MTALSLVDASDKRDPAKLDDITLESPDTIPNPHVDGSGQSVPGLLGSAQC